MPMCIEHVFVLVQVGLYTSCEHGQSIAQAKLVAHLNLLFQLFDEYCTQSMDSLWQRSNKYIHKAKTSD